MGLHQRICVFLLALLCSVPGPAQPARGQVSIRLKWFHQFQFAGYYAAVEKGYCASFFLLRRCDVRRRDGHAALCLSWSMVHFSGAMSSHGPRNTGWNSAPLSRNA